jgi:hypothetical protein
MSVLDAGPGNPRDIPQPARGVAAPRVVFSPVPHFDGVLDGGWWPHTPTLADELPALLGVVGTRFGQVARVSLSATAWDATPREVTCGGRVVAVAWFRALDAHTIRLLGGEFGHLNLLVVPPDTAAAAAAAALALVARRHTVAALHAILAAAPSAERAAEPAAGPTAASGATEPGDPAQSGGLTGSRLRVQRAFTAARAAGLPPRHSGSSAR